MLRPAGARLVCQQCQSILMAKQAGPSTSEVTATSALARAIGRFAQTDGDHTTAIPALTLHRRKAPTEPLHCIYNLGLGVVAQGDKQVLLGDEAIDYGPGQSMLTTIDLPVVSHVTRASAREPFLGMMLTLDVRSIVQMASEMDVPRPRRDDAYRSISFEALDAALLDALDPARQAAGRAGTGSPAGAADPAGNHHPPADRSARPATAAPRHRRVPEPADCEGRRLAQAELRRSRCTGTTWRIART